MTDILTGKNLTYTGKIYWIETSKTAPFAYQQQHLTVKTLPARGVESGLRTSDSLRPQTTVSMVCPLIHHPATQTLPDCDQQFKALELWELWKAKPDPPGISQPGQLTKAVGTVASSTTTSNNFEDGTCKRCWAQSQDFKQFLTTSNNIEGFLHVRVP